MQWLLVLIFTGTLSIYAQDSISWEAKADTVIFYAKSQIGVPYKWGTCKPGESFDCSGLTYYAYKQVGLFCPRSSSGLSEAGEEVPIESSRKGDLILFCGTDPKDKTVGHAGVVISNENGQLKFIHCSSSKHHFGVVITEYHKSGYPKRFIKVKRLIK